MYRLAAAYSNSNGTKESLDMLKTLRTKTRKVMLVTLILIIPSFIFYFGWSANQSRQHAAAEKVAKFQPQPACADGVDSWTSSWVKLERADLAQAQNSLKNELYSLGSADLLRGIDQDKVFPMDDIINKAVDDWYLRYYADKKGIQVSDRELVSLIDSAFQGAGSGYERENYLKRMGMTPAAFEQQLRDNERVQRVQQSLHMQAKVSRMELWDTYMEEKQQLKLDAVAFPASDFEDKVQVTDANLDTYYKATSETFRVGDQRMYRYAYFDKSTLSKQVAITDEALKRFYEENKETQYRHGRQVKVRHILFPVGITPGNKAADVQAQTSETLKKIELVQNQLTNGADFATLANDLSADPTNTSNTQTGAPVKQGGLLGEWIAEDSYSRLGTAFAKAAAKLEKGKISEPIAVRLPGQNGYSLIKCEEVREAGVSSLAEVRDKVYADYRQSELDKLSRAKDTELSKKVQEYTSIQTLAKELNMQDGLTSWVLKTETKLSRDVVLDQTDLEALNTDLHKGEISQMLRNDASLFVVQLVDEQASHVPADFREIRDKVEKAYKKEKSLALAKTAADDFVKSVKVEDFASTPTLAQKAKGLMTTDFFTRRTLPQGLPARPLDFEKDSFLAQKDQIGVSEASGKIARAKDAGGYLVWHVREVKNPTWAEFKKDLPMLEYSATMMRAEGIASEWLRDNRSLTKIEKEKALKSKTQDEE